MKFLDINIHIDDNEAIAIARQVLLDQMHDVWDPQLMEAFHRVVAWMSVPGQYEDGRFDTLY